MHPLIIFHGRKATDNLDSSEVEAKDLRVWDESVKRVANEISEMAHKKEIIKIGVDPFIGKAALGFDKSYKPLIVVSAHPSQQPFVQQLTDKLLNSKSELEIWSSTDNTIDRFCLQSNNSGAKAHTFKELDKGIYFKGRADASSLVIIVLSKKYCASKTSKQQTFYCDLRKKVIAIKFDEFESTEWVSNMFDDDFILAYNPLDIPSFMEQLTQRVWASIKSNNKNTLPSITSNESNKTRDNVNDH